jgi:hypothetical protein
MNNIKRVHGEILTIHVCNDCCHRQGVKPKRPADSGRKSLYCEICQHSNIGSTMRVQVGDWLHLRILTKHVTTN